MSDMLIAIADGFVADPYNGVFEINAGKTRIAPELLAEQPELEDYFERDVSVPGVTSERSEIRIRLPNGETVAA